MIDKLECPLCCMEVYTGLGEGCKMCGMVLEETDFEFCSVVCEIKYKLINELNEIIISER